MGNQNKQNPFEIINERDYIWKTLTKLEAVSEQVESCPHCSKSLSNSFTLISVENNQRAKVPGFECRNCKILFVELTKALDRLIRDNKNAKEITLDGESLWDYSYKRRQEALHEKRMKKIHEKLAVLSQIKGGLILVTLKNEYEQIDCVISNNKEPSSLLNVVVVHYSTLLAREIITSIYHSSRKIQFNGNEYEVIRPYYPSDGKGGRLDLPIEIKPSELRIKPGGGYYTKIESSHDEIVDVLLFSPFTQRYEVARATHNKNNHECFMDIGIFRSFIREYGNPGLCLEFGEFKSFGLSFSDLRTESILRAYGYSVSESEGLTEAERREILAEIVDLELLAIPYIVRLLDFFIRTHTSDKYYYARDKWTRDMRFIANYKINTKRFLIVK